MRKSFIVFVLFIGLLLCAIPAHAKSPKRKVVASWYGKRFEGRKMANHHIFHSSDPTIAASRTLPLGTRIKLENPRNGRKLTVTVKDRGPYVKGRDLDLSRAAARKLGFVKQGLAVLVITAIFPSS